MKNSPADIKVRQERGGRGASGTGAQLSLMPMEQITTLQHMEDPVLEEADIS